MGPETGSRTLDKLDFIFFPICSTSSGIPKNFGPCQTSPLAVSLLLQLYLPSSVVLRSSSQSTPKNLVHVLSRNQVHHVSPLLAALYHILSSLLPVQALPRIIVLATIILLPYNPTANFDQLLWPMDHHRLNHEGIHGPTLLRRSVSCILRPVPFAY